MEARNEPSFTRPSGMVARSKMQRISASVLRPCWAAWVRMARCTASARFRTFTIAIGYLRSGMTSMISTRESPRPYRRLLPLSGWSHESVTAVFPESTGAGGADGVRALVRARLAVCGDAVNRRQVRLHARVLRGAGCDRAGVIKAEG